MKNTDHKKRYAKDKTSYIQIRLSSYEKEKIFREASKRGMSVSEYIRTKLIK